MIVLTACLTVAVTAWAGDPWKEKTYKEWSEQDVRKILDDSPWAKPLVISAMWRGGAPGEARDATDKPDTTLTRSSEGGGGAPSAGGGQSAAGSTADYAQIVYWIRWASARTVLQARARSAMLKGTAEAQAERILNQPITDHQIVVTGQDMSPFSKTDEIGLKEKTFLRLKTTKQKLSPSRVELIRAQDGKSITAIVLHFPLKSDSGEPLIAHDEKGVEFECRTGPLTLKTTFEPLKMVSKAGPDL
jgi:hypothetical protein